MGREGGSSQLVKMAAKWEGPRRCLRSVLILPLPKSLRSVRSFRPFHRVQY